MKLKSAESKDSESSLTTGLLSLFFYYAFAHAISLRSYAIISRYWEMEHPELIFYLALGASVWPSNRLAGFVTARFKIPRIPVPKVGAITLWSYWEALFLSGFLQWVMKEQRWVGSDNLRYILGWLVGGGTAYSIHTLLKRYAWYQKVNSSERAMQISLTIFMFCMASTLVAVAIWCLTEYLKLRAASQ